MNHDSLKNTLVPSFLIVVAMLTGAGVAWAGKTTYKLVMSKDNELCTSMLKLFNEDMKQYGAIGYDKLEPFKRIQWELVKIETAYQCGPVSKSKFDINNDGYDDFVVKWSPCNRGNEFDSLYIFPPDTEWVQSPSWPESNFKLLSETPNVIDHAKPYTLHELDPAKKEWLGAAVGKTTLQPFIWKTTVYITMTDLFNDEWTVIAKYLGGSDDKFKDVCYFRKKSNSN